MRCIFDASRKFDSKIKGSFLEGC